MGDGKDQYEVTRDTLAHYIEKYDLTVSEAADYIATKKTDIKAKDWAETRGVGAGTVSGNASDANRKINNSRLDARVNEEDDRIVIFVEGHEGDEHTLPFLKEQNVAGYEETAHLKGVYETMSAIHGYYETANGEVFEATLFFDGEPYNSFEEFDYHDEFGSWRKKADVILWEK